MPGLQTLYALERQWFQIIAINYFWLGVQGGEGEEGMSEFHGISIVISGNINAYYLYKIPPHMPDKNVLQKHWAIKLNK